jgi:hypothetical protein
MDPSCSNASGVRAGGRAPGALTSIIAVQRGAIVYVDGMVAESIAFRAGRTVGPVGPLPTVTGTE